MSFTSFFVAFIVFAAKVRADCAGASQTQPLYRDYSSAGGDHFYTTDLAEYNAANANDGYAPEGIRALVFTTQVPGSVQFIRLFNGDVTDHFYTTNATEAQAATGYVVEDKAAMYIYPTQLCGSVPLYRSYSSSGTDHFYTVDAAERDGAVASGWNYEFIAGYVFAPAGLVSSTEAASQPAPSKPVSSAAAAKSSASPPASPSPSPPAASPLPSPPPGPTMSFNTGPVLPASTTIIGSAADSASSTPTSASIRLLAPKTYLVALLSLVVTLL
ncbi:hypothetical protein C8R44DRAFT_716565 [Mycena epipterygia]|nr:hypothetical protein C8R44DRAFT_716565 [Mycena epipterygia]